MLRTHGLERDPARRPRWPGAHALGWQPLPHAAGRHRPLGPAMAKLARADELTATPPATSRTGNATCAATASATASSSTTAARAGPVQYRTRFGGLPLNGAFTLWMRRPAAPRQDGDAPGLRRRQRHAGGRFRRCGAVQPGLGHRPRRRQRRLRPGQHRRPGGGSGPLPRGRSPRASPASTRSGQAGGGSEGSGFGGCERDHRRRPRRRRRRRGTGSRGGYGDTGAQ